MKNLLLYTLARLALFAALAGLIYWIGTLATSDGFPLILAMLLGLVLSLPISMVAFKRLRLAVNADIAAVDANRRAQREDLESKLRGERK